MVIADVESAMSIEVFSRDIDGFENSPRQVWVMLNLTLSNFIRAKGIGKLMNV